MYITIKSLLVVSNHCTLNAKKKKNDQCVVEEHIKKNALHFVQLLHHQMLSQMMFLRNLFLYKKELSSFGIDIKTIR